MISTVSVTEGIKETTFNKKETTPPPTIDDNILTTDKSTTTRKVETTSKTQSTPMEHEVTKGKRTKNLSSVLLIDFASFACQKN